MSYNFGNAITITINTVTKQFWDVNGRMSRSDWGHFYSIIFLIGFVLGIIGGIVPALGIVGTIFSLVTLPPNISAAIRRVHDQNKAWWFFLIPFYNLYLLFFVAGDKGSNDFGDDPLGNTADVFS